MGAIYVMWLRQLKKYWRSKPRMISAFGQPLLFLLALGFGLGPIFEKAGGGNYIQFLSPGIIAMSVLFVAMFSGIEVIWDRQFGFLKETLVAPVPRWKIMFGRTLGGATVAALQGVVMLIICLFIGFRPDITGIPMALLFVFLIALLFTAFGTAIASKMSDMQAFPLIMSFIIMPSLFLSGSFFPLENLTGAIKWVSEINPLSYGVDGIRSSLIGTSAFGILPDISLILTFTILICLIGSYLFSKIEI